MKTCWLLFLVTVAVCCVVCIEASIPSYRQECKLTRPGHEYAGPESVTISGLTCQRWDSDYPHSHNYKESSFFPEGSAEAAGNKCRNPESRYKEGVWCYTTDPDIRWDLCDVPFCNVLQEVDVPAFWRKIFEYENRNVEKVTRTSTLKKGIRNLQSNTRTLTATHSVGVVASGDLFEIAKLELSYSFSYQQSDITMTENEIYEELTIEYRITIPPKTKLTRWQLFADVAGTDIGYDHYIDVINDTNTSPRTPLSRATLMIRPQVHYGETRIRIKHFERQQYITVVERKNWPAATLGHSNRFHFILYEDSSGIRIETLNTMHPGYVWAYSSAQGGIYFDWDRSQRNGYNAKQYWSISKSQPIYDGDIVTFRNKYYDSSGLCYHDGPATNVYCLQGREDRWVLEVVF